MKQIVATPHAPTPVGQYSQGVRVGPTVYCAGQIPLDPHTGQLVVGDIALQTRQVLSNLAAVLRAADSSLENVVRTTVFVADLADYHAMNEEYARSFPDNPPSRSTVQVAGLPRGALIEIDAIAVD